MKPSRLFAIGALIAAILLAAWWSTRGDKVVTPGTLASGGAKAAPKGIRWLRPASLPAPVEPPAPAQLAGRVVDALTGEPIAGAEVTLRSDDGDVLRASDSDADGAFRFETVGAAHLIAARAGGYAFFVERLLSGPSPDPSARLLELEPAVRVQGKVVGPDGAPVAGAEVTVEDSEGDWSRWPRPASDAVKSADDGSFDVRDAPSGSLVVRARKDGFAAGEKELDGGVGPGRERAGVVVALGAPRIVTGKVVDEKGAPVAGASVTLAGEDLDPDSPPPSATSDAAGAFSIATSLEEGRVTARKDERFDTEWFRAEPITLVVRPNAAVTGIVVDASGAPIAHARVNGYATDVSVEEKSSQGWSRMATIAVSGTDGRFRLEGLGGTQLRVRAAAGADESDWVDTRPSASDVRLVLKPGPAIRGRVVDPDGHPFTSPATILGRRSAGGWSRSWPATDGTFSADGLDENEWQLVATAPGFAPGAPLTVSLTPDAPPPAPITLTLAARGTVIGTLVDRDTGEPIAGARVSLAEPEKEQFPGEHSARLDWGGAVRSDAKGRFTLPARAGAQQLFVYHPEYRPALQSVTIPDAGDLDLGTIDLVPGPGKSAIFEFSGIGAVLAWKNHSCVVQEIFPNTPAEQAGVRKDDVVLAIDGQSTDDMDLGDIVSRIRGPVGTVVSLTLSRNGNPEPVQIDVVRQQLKL